MNEQYLEPTRRGRIAVLSVIAVAALVSILVYCVAPLLMAPLSATPSLCDELAGYRRLMQWISLLLVAPGIWLALYGRRILKSGQSPPPDAWVLHRVLVKRGAHVTRVGVLLVVIGVVVTLLPAYVWHERAPAPGTAVGQVCEGM